MIRSKATRSFRTQSTLSSIARAMVGLSVGVAAIASCSGDDDDNDDMMGVAGGAGMAGMGGMGIAGGAGMGGMGMGASAGPLGMVSELASGDAFLTATTGAIAGANIWVAMGQLAQLFVAEPAMPAPVLPFTVVPVALNGGALGTPVELPADFTYPEGVATAPDGTLFIGSAIDGSILKVEPGSSVPEVFVAAGTYAERAVLGMFVGVGGQEGVLWFCDSGPAVADEGGALVGVDIANGTEIVRHTLPADGETVPLCNDVVQDGDFNLWISESFGGRIFRVAGPDQATADSAQEWLSSDLLEPPMPGGFGINGLAIVDGWLVVSNNDTGRLYRVDPASTAPADELEEIPLMNAGGETTLCGPDGLSAVPGTTDVLVVENGFCGGDDAASRVSRVTLTL